MIDRGISAGLGRLRDGSAEFFPLRPVPAGGFFNGMFDGGTIPLPVDAELSNVVLLDSIEVSQAAPDICLGQTLRALDF